MQLAQQSGVKLLEVIRKILFHNPLIFKYVIQVINILNDLANICTEIMSYRQEYTTVDKFMKKGVAIS